MKNKTLEQGLFFSMTNEFLNVYLPKQAMRSMNTVSAYQDGLTVFRRYVNQVKKLSLKKFKFSDCTHDFLLEYLTYLKNSGCAETTCNNRLAAVRAYLWYVSDGDVSMQSVALGAAKVPLLKAPKKLREVLSAEESAALLAAPPDTKCGLRDRTMLVLLYDTAVRAGELVGICIGSLELGASIPFIRIHGKGDKERIVSVTDKTVGHLKRYISRFHPDSSLDTPLFYTVIKGKLGPMSVGNVERIVKKYADKIRPGHPTLPEKVYPHMLRRTRATNLYQNGVELELVARILGHASTETTRIYATPSLEMMRDAMGKTVNGIPEETPQWLDDEEELARLCGLR